MMILNRLKEIIGIKNATDVRINPSTEETSSAIEILLTSISALITLIKTALEKIDNQEDGIIYVTVQKMGIDSAIIGSPGSGHHLRIHHIYCVNADTTNTEFYVRNGSGGSIYFPYYLAAYGGAVAQNLKRPWNLSTNTALYYDHISGTSPDLFIVIGYEDITE